MPDRHEWISLSRKLVNSDGNLIAAVSCGVNGEDAGWIEGIWVEEQYRGQGIGTGMLEKALQELKKSGFRRATIGVGSDEPANIRLYHRMGFTEKIKDCYYDPCGLDENMQPVYEEEGWWLLAKEL